MQEAKNLFLGIYNEGKVIVEDCLINMDEFENYQKQYTDYEIVGDTSFSRNTGTRSGSCQAYLHTFLL